MALEVRPCETLIDFKKKIKTNLFRKASLLDYRISSNKRRGVY